LIVRVKLCVAVPALLVAVIVIGYVPPVPAAGVPLNVPVPVPVSTNVTPFGSAPLAVIDGFGFPVAVTVKLPPEPTANVVALALVIDGADCAAATVSVKACVAVPTLLVAVIVIG
jgi:hypothetical protein